MPCGSNSKVFIVDDKNLKPSRSLTHLAPLARSVHIFQPQQIDEEEPPSPRSKKRKKKKRKKTCQKKLDKLDNFGYSVEPEDEVEPEVDSEGKRVKGEFDDTPSYEDTIDDPLNSSSPEPKQQILSDFVQEIMRREMAEHLEEQERKWQEMMDKEMEKEMKKEMKKKEMKGL